MIGRLSGILLEKKPPHLLLEVGGVAYEIQASMQTFYQLPALEQKVILHTHLLVREDAHQLYGFYDRNERALFRALLKVNGVGAKIALAILSSVEPNAFVECVVQQNTAALQRLPGIGKKTAERLVIEMRDRLQDWQAEDGEMSHLLATQPSIQVIGKTTEQDAISALIALGYKPQEASKAIAKVAVEGLTSEELIRSALKNI